MIPFVMLQYPLFVVSLVPVILIEAWWINRSLITGWWWALWLSGVGNILSTGLGAVVMVVLLMADLPLATLAIGTRDKRYFYGYVALQVLFYVIFWAGSAWSEGLWLTSKFHSSEKRRAWRTAVEANVVSYMGLLLAILVMIFSGGIVRWIGVVAG